MKSVVICGSRRFKKEILDFAAKLKRAGVIVYLPFLNTDKRINELPENFKNFAFTGLTLHHFSLIRKADAVFIYNKGGYIGTSTTLEIGFATALGKPIYILSEKDDDPCRRVLYDEVVKTPAALIKKLK